MDMSEVWNNCPSKKYTGGVLNNCLSKNILELSAKKLSVQINRWEWSVKNNGSSKNRLELSDKQLSV